MNRKIFLKELDEPHIHILTLFTEEKEFITSYKNNKVYNIKLLKELNIIMVKIYNYLKDKRYNYIKIFIRDIFEKTKKLILNHYKLN